MKFEDVIDKKVDMSKVQLDTLKPWITQRITEILGFDDDVVIEFIFNQLEARVTDQSNLEENATSHLLAHLDLAQHLA
ncbi:SRRM1 [Bugula neritina]|uniref:SRRM1 n=1 Tax=Bugula neritina TaxID=10212 RepID=A0A7J7KHZ3_BUGNE|nr:SRRM1 [Bugula neritina]